MRQWLVKVGLSAISLATVAGCSGKVMNDVCAGGAANHSMLRPVPPGERVVQSAAISKSRSCPSAAPNSSQECGGSLLVRAALVKTANVLLVIDKSSSMTKPYVVRFGSIQVGHDANRASCRVHAH